MSDINEIQRNATPAPPRNPIPATLSPDAVPASFTPAQTIAMGQLLAGRSKTDAARAAGVDRTTLHAWLKKDPAFRAFFNSARTELVHQLQQRQLLLASMALRTQEKLLRSRKTPAAVKAKVAADILSRTPPGVDGPETPESALVLISEENRKRRSEIDRACVFLKDDNPEHRSILAMIAPEKLQSYWYRVQDGREKADPEIAELLEKQFGHRDD